MRGNKKLALIGMAIILSLSLLAFGLGTTVFAADTENGEEPNVFETFVSKVADKLGLEDEVVADAMQEARQEMMQERLQERLQQAIDEGLITQEQADEITTWLEDRPEALDQLGFRPGPGGPMMHGAPPMPFGQGCGS